MERRYTCPRCGAPVQATQPDREWTWRDEPAWPEPSPASDDGLWWCQTDGAVAPYVPAHEPTVHALLDHLSGSSLPTWLPWPLPEGWSVAGVASVGPTRRTASVAALSGPDPLGGPGDLLVVCEEPGTGLGSRLAGVPGPDPGPQLRHVAPQARLQVDGRATALWWVGADRDRDVLVGEASGCWLWLVAWPATSGALVHEGWHLVDLHDLTAELDLIPLTGLCERLPG